MRTKTLGLLATSAMLVAMAMATPATAGTNGCLACDGCCLTTKVAAVEINTAGTYYGQTKAIGETTAITKERGPAPTLGNFNKQTFGASSLAIVNDLDRAPAVFLTSFNGRPQQNIGNVLSGADLQANGPAYVVAGTSSALFALDANLVGFTNYRFGVGVTKS